MKKTKGSRFEKDLSQNCNSSVNQGARDTEGKPGQGGTETIRGNWPLGNRRGNN